MSLAWEPDGAPLTIETARPVERRSKWQRRFAYLLVVQGMELIAIAIIIYTISK